MESEHSQFLSTPALPVQPLNYSPPPRSNRPGILTAVGVISLVIGALSVLIACSSAVTLIMMQAMQRAAPAAGPGAATAPATVMFAMPMTPASVIAGGIDAVLRLVLALLLVAAGILVLRDHRLGRRLHLIWAWIKIPAALLAAMVSWQQMSGMFASMPMTPGSPVTPQYMDTMMLVGVLVQAAFACAYPVGILIVMKTRTVRDYYLMR